MRRANLSLYHLAGCLVPAGLLLLFVPEFATKLLLSNQTYDYAPFPARRRPAARDRDPHGPDHSPQAFNALRQDLARASPHQRDPRVTPRTTGDPFVAVVLVIVLIGVALTAASYLMDRRES